MLGSLKLALTELFSARGLFGILLAVASIVKPPQGLEEVINNPIVFWGPLEFVADNSRTICLALSILLIVLCRPRWPFIGPLTPIFFLHLLIYFRNTYSGASDSDLFVSGAIIMISACAAYSKYQHPSGGAALTTPLVVGSLAFMGVTLAQYVMDPDATMRVSGRFSGTTSNPQMFVLCLSVVIPSLLFFFHASGRWRYCIALLAPLVLYFSILTGSRLGIVTVAATIVFYYRERMGRIVILTMPVILVLMTFFVLSETSVEPAGSRILSLEDTRGYVWVIQVNEFLDNPLYGRPLAQGERLGFGENSYLAAGAELGIAGIAMIGLLVVYLGSTLAAVIRYDRSNGWRPDSAMAFSILASVLVGACFEAALLGVYTLPLLAVLLVSLLCRQPEKAFNRRAGIRSPTRQPITVA